ncbi:MFS transporter, sugar porter (SP) family [Sphingomonas gellani]|uniref:MFS transporter, sugar porter (SP) family n=1 Tax=Sphingomonas gellani TaxID=1166340 RepID=A0A1H8DWF9_9SPHN|nr:sugar porter family MFS transporter [Sphingomonas gellani]SEN11649.1 MFS transporter, sugar porter (SP) family [Sphingomonas gellani]
MVSSGAVRPRLLFTAFAVSLSGLLFGFDTAVIAGVTEALRQQFGLSAAALGVTVSSALLGTMVGAALAGVYGDRRGARAGLRLAAALYLFSGFGCAFAWSWSSLILFRIMAGVAIGASSVLAPVYLAEIAPAERRGAVVGSFQISIVVGILVAYVSNAAVGATVGAGDAWRWKLGLTALPAILFQVLLVFVPDSPRSLMLRGRREEAAQAAMLLHGHQLVDDPHPAPAATVSLSALWTEARRPAMLAIVIGALNQLTGINAILYYLNDIFAAAGFRQVSADLQAVAVGLANLVFTAVGMLLIDRLGRRPLLLAGGAAMSVLLLAATAIMLGLLPRYLMVGVLVGFIAAFATSQGAVIWVYLSEIFPARFRAAGQALGAGTIWLFDALVAALFPIAAAASPAAPFLFFALCMATQCVLVFRWFPETKGASLEQIEREMHPGARLAR